VFSISEGGVVHSGVGSRFHMWKSDGSPIDEGEPPINQVIDGLVAARIVRDDGDTVLVAVPDGEVIRISSGALSDRPSASQSVPIG
jgi:hypothetical protein